MGQVTIWVCDVPGCTTHINTAYDGVIFEEGAVVKAQDNVLNGLVNIFAKLKIADLPRGPKAVCWTCLLDKVRGTEPVVFRGR